jgi:hypothetical protein
LATIIIKDLALIQLKHFYLDWLSITIKGMPMILKRIIKSISIFPLLSLLLTYVLGASLADYSAGVIHWSLFVEGAFFLVLMTMSFGFLRLLNQINSGKHSPEDEPPEFLKKSRLVIALLTATFLTVAITIFVGWMWTGVMRLSLLVIILLLLIVGIFFLLSESSEVLLIYESIFEVLLFVMIPPALSYFLQLQTPQLLLTLSVIGLVPAYLAYNLLIQIQHYGYHQKVNDRMFVVRVGWAKAMVFHNALILLSFAIFAITGFLGMPWDALWPVFLVLPLGLVEIWLMERVKAGAKPLWGVMKVATACVFIMPAYLMAFAFWIG